MSGRTVTTITTQGRFSSLPLDRGRCEFESHPSKFSVNRFNHGKIAKTRAGKPEPPLGFGKDTTTIAPASGI